eukprot:4852931-Alexandrium_andersonii.AAC.1
MNSLSIGMPGSPDALPGPSAAATATAAAAAAWAPAPGAPVATWAESSESLGCKHRRRLIKGSATVA